MPQRGGLRASDADRERVAERLRQAAAEGRLLAHELEQRLATALRAQTYGELDSVVSDLPGGRLARRQRSSTGPWLRPALALALAIPIALAIIAAVVFVVTGVFAVWMLWIGLWFFFGRRRRYHGGRPIGMCSPRRAQPRYWL